MSLLKLLVRWLFEIFTALGRILGFLLGKRGREASCKPCPPALKKPDPFLYAQYYLMGLGLPVTWDNPDISIFDGGVAVDPHSLQPAKTYTVAARIWNGSTDIPVVDLKVSFSYLSFGMGVVSHPIGDTLVDLGAKGLPGCPAFAYAKWTTPAVAGHYCVQVLLSPPDDSNWLNNLGQLNTDVAHANSPAVFSFAVGNHVGPRPRRVRFRADAYTIPPLPKCSQGDRDVNARRVIQKNAPPVPAGWTVVLAPSELLLAAADEKQVQVQITPPAGFTGTQPINISGWDDAGPVGGVTLLVEVP